MAVLSRRQMKQDADFIFHELTRSICPECRSVIDAQIIIRDNRVYMRKRCPEHGWFEGLISSDAEMYVDSIKFNKPGTIPLDFSTQVKDGCPLDCGLCPEHKQHIYRAIRACLRNLFHLTCTMRDSLDSGVRRNDVTEIWRQVRHLVERRNTEH